MKITKVEPIFVGIPYDHGAPKPQRHGVGAWDTQPILFVRVGDRRRDRRLGRGIRPRFDAGHASRRFPRLSRSSRWDAIRPTFPR